MLLEDGNGEELGSWWEDYGTAGSSFVLDSRDIAQARTRAYAAAEKVHFDGMFYRRDIAYRALGRS